MLILPQEVEVTMRGYNIKFYEKLGYEIPKHKDKNYRMSVKEGTKIIIKVEDLSLGSNVMIKAYCDYCGELIERPYASYLEKHNKPPYKDCCGNEECKNKKREEVSLIKYGTTHPSKANGVNKISAIARTLSDEFVTEQFEKLNYIKLDKYIKHDADIRYICIKHFDKGVQTTTYHRLHALKGSCRYCGYEAIGRKAKERFKTKGHPAWKGGTTQLQQFLRNDIVEWKKDSMKNCNYKCMITGDNFDVIHHPYGFNFIVLETLEICKLPIYEDVSNYTFEEINKLKEVCLELHYKYGLGFCLTKEIHNLFHSNYGYGNNTLDQFEEFKQRYLRGEFKEVI